VQQGVPFRDAHQVVGELVREAEERGVSLEQLVKAEPRLGREALAVLEPGQSVRRRTTPGGAGPEPLRQQVAAARTRLEEQRTRLDEA
jgi:argininosuccinate lyase